MGDPAVKRGGLLGALVVRKGAQKGLGTVRKTVKGG
jgi:hypothetical protein